MIFGEGDERAPGFQETRPIVLHAPGPVAPDERVHVLQSELLGGEDDFLEMSDHALRRCKVGIERVRIVTKAGEADAVFRAQRIHVVGFRMGEAGDIDVRDAGELAVGLADGPAHGLDTREALRAGKSEDLFEIQLREDGGDKAEVHWSGWLSTKEHSAAEPQPKQRRLPSLLYRGFPNPPTAGRRTPRRFGNRRYSRLGNLRYWPYSEAASEGHDLGGHGRIVGTEECQVGFALRLAQDQ